MGRADLITEYKNRNSSDSKWYILKISYNGLAEALKKETAKFNKLIQDIDLNEADIDHDYSNYSEIMDNMGSDSDSSIGSGKGLGIDAMYKSPVKMENDGKKEIPEKEAIITADVGKGSESELYEESVPITDNLSVDQRQIKIEHEEKKEISK